MQKKMHTQKSAKTYSKSKVHQPEYDSDFQAGHTRSLFGYQISRLEKMILQQIQTRQNREKELLGMIRHLDQSKKSKLPSKPQLSNMSKLFSPTKCAKKPEQERQINECKNLLTTIKSEREFELNASRLKVMELQKQTHKLNKKIEAIEQVLGQHAGQLSQLRRSQKEVRAQLGSQLDNFKEEQVDIRKFVEKIPLTVEKELKIELEFMIVESRQSQIAFIQSLNRKVEERTLACQGCISTCLETLNRVYNETIMSFDVLEHKVKVASESIIQTKETIEETIFGSDYRSRDKFESLSSLDCTPESTATLPRRPSENMERFNYMDSRVQGLERRMDLIYAEYLSRPFHKVHVEEPRQGEP